MLQGKRKYNNWTQKIKCCIADVRESSASHTGGESITAIKSLKFSIWLFSCRFFSVYTYSTYVQSAHLFLHIHKRGQGGHGITLPFRYRLLLPHIKSPVSIPYPQIVRSAISLCQWAVNVWRQLLSYWSGWKVFEWIKLLQRHLYQILEKWASRKLIITFCVKSLLTTHAGMKNWSWNPQWPTNSFSKQSFH